MEKNSRSQNDLKCFYRDGHFNSLPVKLNAFLHTLTCFGHHHRYWNHFCICSGKFLVLPLHWSIWIVFLNNKAGKIVQAMCCEAIHTFNLFLLSKGENQVMAGTASSTKQAKWYGTWLRFEDCCILLLIRFRVTSTQASIAQPSAFDDITFNAKSVQKESSDTLITWTFPTSNKTTTRTPWNVSL